MMFVGLRLVDPDRHLAPSGWISQQHDRTATGRIQGDPGDMHFDHCHSFSWFVMTRSAATG
jgi:hypothetical protein